MWRGFSETGGSPLTRNTDDTDQMDFHGFVNHISAKQKCWKIIKNRIICSYQKIILIKLQ